VAASWSFTENCHASATGGALGSTNREEGGLRMRAHVAPCALVPRRRGRVHLRLREARPSSPSSQPGGRKTDDPQKESPGCQAWWKARTRSLAPARFTRAASFSQTPPSRPRGSLVRLFPV
jgi:hypothetical protein